MVGAAAERIAVRVAEAGLVGYIGYWAAVAVVAGAVCGCHGGSRMVFRFDLTRREEADDEKKGRKWSQ